MPRNVARQGFSDVRAASRTAVATSSSGVTSGGMKQVSTESTDGSAKALASASENCSPLASDGSATGPWATSRPQLTHASAVSAPRASELPTTATRLPWGSGWCTTSWATSNIWWTFSTRMTPAWRSIASKASGRTRVCRARCPGGTP